MRTLVRRVPARLSALSWVWRRARGRSAAGRCGGRAGVARGNRSAAKRLRARLAALEAQLAALTGEPPPPALPPPPPAAPPPHSQPSTCRRAQRAPADRAAPCRSTATLSAASKIFNPDIAVIGNFLGAAGKNDVNPEPALEMPEVGSVVPGDRRSVRARRLLHGVRRGGRGSRGRLHHVSDAARRPADESRQDARGVRQGQHAAHARCRGPIGRWSPRTCSAAKRASPTPGSRSRA